MRTTNSMQRIRNRRRSVATILLVLLQVATSVSVTTAMSTRDHPQSTRKSKRKPIADSKRRHLARGQEWIDQQNSNQEERAFGDNIFNRHKEKDCACNQRNLERNLGIGACTCTDDDYDDDGYRHKVQATIPPAKKHETGKGTSYYSSYGSKSTKRSKKSSKSYGSKGSKSYGKGYSYDDDYIYPTRSPTVPPKNSPNLSTSTPTRSPVNIGQPTLSPAFTPTNTGRVETSVPTLKPTSRPTPSKAPVSSQDCKVNAEGLYGTNVGLATEFQFYYQTQVIPSVTVLELNMDMLPKIEVEMGNDMLPKLFPAECSSSIATNTVPGLPSASARTTSTRPALDERDGPSDFVKHGDVYVFTLDDDQQGSRRRMEFSQLTALDGMSIKPRDTVDTSEQCQGLETKAFPCHVIMGSITVFSKTNLNEAERLQIESAIRQTIINGDLVQADNRFLDITWSRFEEVSPPPPNNGPSSPPGQQEKDGLLGFGLEWWAFLLIGLGAFLIILLNIFFLCRRRNSNRMSPLQESKEYDVEESSSSSSSSASANQSSPSGESFGHDYEYPPQGFEDEYSNSQINNAQSLPSASYYSDDDPTRNAYFHPSNDQISESHLPNIDDPIIEERAEDISARDIHAGARGPAQYSSDGNYGYESGTGASGNVDTNYDSSGANSNGVSSYGSRNHISNIANIYAHNPNVDFKGGDEVSHSPPTSGDLTLISKSHGSLSQGPASRTATYSGEPSMSTNYRSSDPHHSSSTSSGGPSARTLERNDQQFRGDSYHDAEREFDINPQLQQMQMQPQDPEEQRYSPQDNVVGVEYEDEVYDQPTSFYTTSMQSEMRQSFRSEGDESEYETVEEEYEIEYTSHSERQLVTDSGGEAIFEDQTWDGEDENYHHDNISASASASAHKSSSGDSSTPLPFLAHNAQQQKGFKTSFDSLRKKWEHSNSSKSRSNSAGTTDAEAVRSV